MVENNKDKKIKEDISEKTEISNSNKGKIKNKSEDSAEETKSRENSGDDNNEEIKTKNTHSQDKMKTKDNNESKKKEPVKEESSETKEQVSEHEKIFKTVLLVMAWFVVLVLVVQYLYFHSNDFSYKNIKFTRVKQGRLIFYKTTYPLYSNGRQVADFDLFLRTEPQKLGEDIPFNGSFDFKKNMVINMTKDFNCQGDGVIAVANLVRFLNSAGTKVIRDENATCDPFERYIYLNIKAGNKTEVIETAPACYEITIKGCQILQGTERYILEGLVKLNEVQSEYLKKQ